MKKRNILTIIALIVMSMVFLTSCDSPFLNNLLDSITNDQNAINPPAAGTSPLATGTNPPATGTNPPATGANPPAAGANPLATGGLWMMYSQYPMPAAQPQQQAAGTNQQAAGANPPAAQPQPPPAQLQPPEVAARQALTAIQTLIGPAGAPPTTLEQDAIAVALVLPDTGFPTANDAAVGRAKIRALVERIDPQQGDNLEELVVAAALAADRVAANRNNDQLSQDLVDAVQIIERTILGPFDANGNPPRPGGVSGIVYKATHAESAAGPGKRVLARTISPQYDRMITQIAISELEALRNKLLGIRGNTQASPAHGAATGITALTDDAITALNAL